MRKLAILVALVATLAAPASVFAVSSTVTETLTVQSQITMTGVPASYSFGSSLGGNTVSAPSFSVTITSNSPNGYAWDVSATDLSAGSQSIAATNRLFKVTPPDPATCSVATKWTAAGGGSYTGPANTFERLCSTAGAGPDQTFAVVSKVAIPGSAVPGAYTGSVTFRAQVNP